MKQKTRIEISAEDKTSAAFRSVSSGLSSMTAGFGRVVGMASALGAAIGVGALASGIKNLVSESMSYIDATGKLSDRIGISTEKLIGFQHAATLGGMSIDGMNDILAKMSVNLGKAASGTGEAARTLKKLGLDAKEISTLKADEQFLRIAQAISELETQSEKAAAAQEIFGRSGREVVTILSQGRKGFEATQKDAEKLGLTLSRFDAAKVEQANDEFYRFQSTITGLARRFTVQLAPVLSGVSGYLTDAATNIEGFETMGTRAFENITSLAGPLGDAMQLVAVGIKAVELSGRLLEYGLLKSFKTIESGVVPFYNAFVDGAKLIQNSFKLSFDDIAGYIEGWGDTLEKMTSWMPWVGDYYKKVADGYRSVASEVRGINLKPQDVKKLTKSDFLKDWVGISEEELKKTKDDLLKLGDFSGTTWGDKFAKILEDMKAKANDAAAKFKELSGEINLPDVEDEPERKINRFQKAFGSAFDEMKEKSREFKDSFVSDLTDMLLSSDRSFAAIRDKYLNMIAKTILENNMTKILFGAEGKEGAAGAGLFGSFGKMLGFAGGGEPPIGRPSIVGENGPEIIVPKSATRVFSNKDSAAMLGGGATVNVYQTVNITTGAKENMAAEMRSLFQPLTEMIRNALINDVQRNGPFARAVRSI